MRYGINLEAYYWNNEIPDTAILLLMSGGDPKIKELILKNGFKEFTEKMHAVKLREESWRATDELRKRFGERYDGLKADLDEALRAEKLKIELAAIEDRARKKGFASAEEMGGTTKAGIQALKEEVGGEPNFKLLTEGPGF